jgi:hypothetical protein
MSTQLHKHEKSRSFTHPMVGRLIIEEVRGRSIGSGFGLAVFCLWMTAMPACAQLHVGPVYTNTDRNSDVAFPRIGVVIASSSPQQAAPKPGDLTLIEDGLEGGHATAVRSFESTGYPLAAAVGIDVSGSMAGQPLKIVRDSLAKFVSDARAEDKVGVVTIADDATWDVPFDADRQTLKLRLQNIHSRGKLTRLYDGLLAALGGFAPSLPARRELTVISDGHDEGSRARLQDVIEMARGRGITVDTIGLTRSSPAYLQCLMTLATQTGGTFRQVHSDRELQSLIENGLANLKASPVATFEVQHIRPDGKSHHVAVRLKNATGPVAKTVFQAPEHAANPLRYFVDHLPRWAYALLALVCVALIVLVLLVFRRRGKRPIPLENMGYDMVAPSLAAQMETPSSGAETVSRESGFGPPGVSAPNQISQPTPYQSPAAKSPVQSKARMTRVAGVFLTPGETVARLEVLTGALAGRFFDVTHMDYWIGAAETNDLVIPEDATISSRHAYLHFEDPILVLTDNQSTNGTRVNGELLRGVRCPLRPDDQIQIGRTLFRVVSVAQGT